MAHRIFGRKLSRTTNQRKALLRSLANSVILYEKVKTTKAKAKAVKPFLEKLITVSKNDSIFARRTLVAKLGLENSASKLLEVIGPTFKERPGGYLRLTKLSPRSGDSANMVVIEFVEQLSAPKKIVKGSAGELKTKEPRRNRYSAVKKETKKTATESSKKINKPTKKSAPKISNEKRDK